jgi:hypothetical protein
MLIIFYWNLHSGTFWGLLAEEITAAEPPTGFQGINKYH